MNNKTFEWISALIRNDSSQTTVRASSEIGRFVIERYQAGRIKNNQLIFTAQDKTSLRRQIIQEFNLDPFNADQLPASRIEVAKYHHNEKLAKNPVSYDHVLVSSPNKTLNLNKQTIQLQTDCVPNAGMMCLSSGITRIDHDAIVVVENLAIMQLCSTFELPARCQDALWIYRGDHKTGARIDACHDLLNRFGADKSVIVFSDMDPKGLEIALTVPHADYWLGPESSTWDNCFKSKQASRSGFDKQGVAMDFLLKECEKGFLSESFKALALRIKKERSSYRQEHSYAFDVRLSLFPITKETSKNADQIVET